MKKYLLWGALVLVLGGCQTSSDYYGSGPITLSENVVRKYEDRYLKKPGSMMFYVTADGRQSGFWYCDAGPDLCRASHDMKFTLDSCKKKAGQPCYVFDEGGWVVWKGPVTWGNSGRRTNNDPKAGNYTGAEIEKLSKGVICAKAVSPDTESLLWNSSEQVSDYVAEAKRRRFKVLDCQMENGHVGDQPHQRSGLRLNNKELCSLATDGNPGTLEWQTSNKGLWYVYEAKYRQLTLASCSDALNAGAGSAEAAKPGTITVNPKKTGRDATDFSDLELCHLTVANPEGRPGWTTNKHNLGHVYVAQLRQLTPEKCMRKIAGTP